MKHCVCSDLLPASWRRLFDLLMLMAAMAVTACSKVDEIAFSGTIVDTRECTASYLEPNLGYVVALSSPDSIGRPYTVGNVTYPNAVILYEPDRLIYRNDRVHGSFYLDDKYSRANCSLHWTDMNLPEGVFLEVTVD